MYFMRWIGFLVCLRGGQVRPDELPRHAKELDVSAKDAWADTGLDLRAGDVLTISASGNLKVRSGKSTSSVTAAGANRGFRDLLKDYPVNEAGQGALIGRIGSSDAATPFLVGASKSWTAPRAGRLFLGINKSSNDAPDGTFHVKIEFTSRGAEVSTAPKDPPPLKLTVEMIDRIPRRVVDAQGNPGDNTNFVVVGDEQKVLEAFQAAGWVQVDRGKTDAILNGILSVLNKDAYVQLPMSELMLVRPRAGLRAGPRRTDRRGGAAPSPAAVESAVQGGGPGAVGGRRDPRHRVRPRSAQ